MKRKIVSKFQGEINGLVFTWADLYSTTAISLGAVESIKGVEIESPEFTQYVSDKVEQGIMSGLKTDVIYVQILKVLKGEDFSFLWNDLNEKYEELIGEE